MPLPGLLSISKKGGYKNDFGPTIYPNITSAPGYPIGKERQNRTNKKRKRYLQESKGYIVTKNAEQQAHNLT